MSFNVLGLLLLDVGFDDEPAHYDPGHHGRHRAVEDGTRQHLLAQMDGEMIYLIATR